VFTLLIQVPQEKLAEFQRQLKEGQIASAAQDVEARGARPSSRSQAPSTIPAERTTVEVEIHYQP
jgi:hypothetical protein